MLFNSLTYLLFLPIVTLVYWLLPARARQVLLLIASYFFYMSWMKIYGLLLFGLTAANFIIGLFIGRAKTHANKRLIFTAGLAINLGCLVLFKYTNFFIESLRQTYTWMAPYLDLVALPSNVLTELPIILPLGISFFVFEFIHYLVDVFRGEKAVTSPVRFVLFAAFFPSQIAGPIKRFEDFERQLVAGIHFKREMFQSGVYLIAQGMFKKVALGDNLATLVQAGFANPTMMSTLDTWVCVMAFALQIYYDFSGYTDIGRGSAMVLGFSLPENFNMPYMATSLRDFWHRWHISLSTWLRDYLYIPMGGSRKGKNAASMNLMITMLLGGLWHGASWHYVVWGAFHGAGLAVNRVFDDAVAKSEALKRMTESIAWKAFSHVFTFMVVCVGWVVFRANNMTEAMNIYTGMFTLRPSTTPDATILQLFFQSPLPVALTLYAIAYSGFKLYSKYTQGVQAPIPLPQIRVPVYVQAAGLTGFAMLVFGLAPQQSIPFIYFQF